MLAHQYEPMLNQHVVFKTKRKYGVRLHGHVMSDNTYVENGIVHGTISISMCDIMTEKGFEFGGWEDVHPKEVEIAPCII